MATEPKDPEQRRILRDLRQQGQSAMTWGLPNPVTEAVVVGVGIVLRDRLEGGAEGRGASGAAEIAAGVLEKTVSRMPQAEQFACRKGCSFCCHSAVAVTAPEVFLIAHSLREKGEAVRDAAQTACRASAGTTLEAMLADTGACPLLVADACSVHEVRPLACRQYVSLSAEACRRALESGDGAFPFVPGATNVGVLVRSLLLSAVHSVGRPAEIYELAGALAVALERPDAEQRWLAGEDVLAGALKLPQPPHMQQSVGRWAPMLQTFLAAS